VKINDINTCDVCVCQIMGEYPEINVNLYDQLNRHPTASFI